MNPFNINEVRLFQLLKHEIFSCNTPQCQNIISKGLPLFHMPFWLVAGTNKVL